MNDNDKIVRKVSVLDLKKTEKGISGFCRALGGFFIVDKNSVIPEDGYVNVELIRVIIDKKGNEVPIFKLIPHQHQWRITEDTDYCVICQCGEKKRHQWETIGYEISETAPMHREMLRCAVCGKETKSWWQYHSFSNIYEIEEHWIERCRCGKTRTLLKAEPFLKRLSIEDIKKERERFYEWKKRDDELYKVSSSLGSEILKLYDEVKIQKERDGITVDIPPELQYRAGSLVDGYTEKICVSFDGKRFMYDLYYWVRDGAVPLKDKKWFGDVYGYTTMSGCSWHPTSKIPDSLKRWLEEKGVFEKVKKEYYEAVETIENMKKKIEELKKKEEEIESKRIPYEFENEIIRELWKLRTDPMLKKAYKELDPYDGFFGGISIRKEEFLNALIKLIEGDQK